MTSFHHEKRQGFELEVIHDAFPQEPESIFEIVGWHRRYDFGKKWEDPAPFLEEAEVNDWVVFPLYMLDHSGCAFSLSPFSCPWDSGQLGYVYVTPKRWKSHMGINLLNTPLARVRQAVEQDLASYQSYFNGESYEWYIVGLDGETVESCAGYDDLDYCIEEGKNALDCVLQEAAA